MSEYTAYANSNLDEKMLIETIDSYSNELDQFFTTIVKTYNKLQLQDYSKRTVESGNTLLKHGSDLLHNLKEQVKSIETVLAECSDFVEEVTADLTCPKKPGDYVYHTRNGMLAYLKRDLVLKPYTAVAKSDPGTNSVLAQSASQGPSGSAQPVSPAIKVESVVIGELGYSIKLPIVTDLKQIPNALYYLKPTDKSKAGLYINILGNKFRIPFPEVVDSKKDHDRKHSIRCKYHTKSECDAQRMKMAKSYNSTVRNCNFAHTGDQITKIGYPSRCPSIPNFGNPKTMPTDIKCVGLDDIKNTLLYGLNDLAVAAIWMNYTGANLGVIDDLDVA